ncbi:MAG: sirohydrochlorin nickelochelatase [Euryarchaeota archaeon]|nr:sirohydrochlorin nickelochelatase [Euryarchaeota archaeon]
MAETGIVLVGHGSLRPETKRAYEELAEKVAAGSGRAVRVGYLQGQEPNLKAAVEGMVREGFSRIAVIPLFVMPGAHVNEDIPVLLGLEEGEVPDYGYGKVEVPEGVEVLYGRHLGADDRLVDIVLDRIREVLEHC